MTFAEARKKIELLLVEMERYVDGGVIVLEEHTITKPYGWVFPPDLPGQDPRLTTIGTNALVRSGMGASSSTSSADRSLLPCARARSSPPRDRPR